MPRLATSLLAFPLMAALGGCASSAGSAPGHPAVGGVTRYAPAFDAVVAPDARVERLAEGFTWAEGPAWVADGGYLLFTDVPEKRLHRWS